jgi:hypothetical protein
MLTLLSGFAAEREVIRERSLAGAQRVAQSGGWLGGRLPFGYCQAGSQRQSGLILSEEPLPGVDLSAAEVIRRIFPWVACPTTSRSWGCAIGSGCFCRLISCGRTRETAQPPACRRHSISSTTWYARSAYFGTDRGGNDH